MYTPGNEPEKLKKILNPLLKELRETYTDGVVDMDRWNHERWDRAAGYLVQQLGYPNGRSFLTAYGFTIKNSIVKKEDLADKPVKKPEHANNKSSETVLRDLRHEDMQHEEKMSQHAVSRSKFGAMKYGFLTVTVIVICVFIFYMVNRSTWMQDKNATAVDKYISQAQFDDARDEASKLDSRGTITDRIENFIEGRREQKRIDRKEEEWILENGITIGRASKSFAGQNYEDMRKELIEKGFNKDKIKLTALNDIPRKYKNSEFGTVTSISISGDEKFNEKDKFDPDSIIELYYVGKK